MADSRKLTKFSVEPEGTHFIFHIEDDRGQRFELSATRDQVDIIADTLDEILAEDESGDEVTDADDALEDDDFEDEDDDEFGDADEFEDGDDEVEDDPKEKSR